MAIAADVGLDVQRLRRDMENPAIEEYLDETIRLARTLGINGTPAFVIGDTLVPGAVDGARLGVDRPGPVRRLPSVGVQFDALASHRCFLRPGHRPDIFPATIPGKLVRPCRPLVRSFSHDPSRMLHGRTNIKAIGAIVGTKASK